MKLLQKLLLTLGISVVCFSLIHSQTTIGSALKPNAASILDLKEKDTNGANSTKGLMLPRVKIITLKPKVGELAKSLEAGSATWNELTHTGLMVYNMEASNATACKGAYSGVYVWNGTEWDPIVVTNNTSKFTGTIKTDNYVGANSYIVKPGGSVEIEVERAYQIWNDYAGNNPSSGKALNLSAVDNLSTTASFTPEIVWEDNYNIISNLSVIGTGKTAKLKVETSNSGNALVSIKTTTGKVVWQWHIWVTNDNFEDTPKRYTTNESTYWFMDRLLGATSSQDNGLYYQWGRPTPFTTKKAINSTFAKVSESANLTLSIQSPDFIIYENDMSHDWYSSAKNIWLNRWGDSNINANEAKSPFDPCPKGWRVPSFRNNKSPWECLEIPNNPYINGWNFDNLMQNLGFYKANGYLANINASAGDINTAGYEWTATGTPSMAYTLKFTNAKINPEMEMNKANALGVRCIKDIQE